MNPAMYIFVNTQAGMSAGKMSAQAAHAAVEAFRISRNDLIEQWYLGKHYKKLVMDGGDGFTLGIIQNYLESRSFATDLILDEGRTEGTWMVPTALGVEIVDKDDPHTAATFESFKTYKEPQQPRDPTKQAKRRFWGRWGDWIRE